MDDYELEAGDGGVEALPRRGCDGGTRDDGACCGGGGGSGKVVERRLYFIHVDGGLDIIS